MGVLVGKGGHPNGPNYVLQDNQDEDSNKGNNKYIAVQRCCECASKGGH